MAKQWDQQVARDAARRCLEHFERDCEHPAETEILRGVLRYESCGLAFATRARARGFFLGVLGFIPEGL